jgi:hypothetical protein
MEIQGEEHKQSQINEPAHEPFEEIPFPEQVALESEPDVQVGGKDPLVPGFSAESSADQHNVEAVLKETHSQEAQSIGLNAVAEEHQSPEPASPEEAIHGQPVITEEIPTEPQEYAAVRPPSPDAPLEASPEQSEYTPPVSDEPLAETEKDGDGASEALSLKQSNLQPVQ